MKSPASWCWVGGLKGWCPDDVAETSFFLLIISFELNWILVRSRFSSDSISSTTACYLIKIKSRHLTDPSCGRVVYTAQILGAVNFLRILQILEIPTFTCGTYVPPTQSWVSIHQLYEDITFTWDVNFTPKYGRLANQDPTASKGFSHFKGRRKLK